MNIRSGTSATQINIRCFIVYNKCNGYLHNELKFFLLNFVDAWFSRLDV